jgi:hypothetical protein
MKIGKQLQRNKRITISFVWYISMTAKVIRNKVMRELKKRRISEKYLMRNTPISN